MALSLEEILKQQSGESTELEKNQLDINNEGIFSLEEILKEKPSTISQPEKKSNDRNESLEPEAEDNSNISGLTAATAGIISGANIISCWFNRFRFRYKLSCKGWTIFWHIKSFWRISTRKSCG